ncbi:hypothetical protein ESA94_16525 [Lacibacter luteus]|uniref:Uncharacterized protein n=1 Tax=Lacibacter luteus TaxID=2508719 RepID=A0A4V1M7A8_9BACT|nr:hypothetical protein [Lacibacter luteus]RXK58988.1 hypothetical protein ESA94_16525 [Lacibacter luteus]
MKPLLTLVTVLFLFLHGQAQEVTDTTIQHPATDTILRIRNLNPYFTVHVDSSLSYKLEINKEQKNYYWYLKNSPVGLRINKDNGTLTFKAEKAYFLSGRLKYDVEYKVQLGVQSLDNPTDKADTMFTIVFFNTEIIQSKIRPSVSASITVDEGDTARISLNCENGNFPIEYINFESSIPIKPEYQITKCKDDFVWFVPYDFVKDNDPAKTKEFRVLFIGADKFRNKDTAVVRVVVRDAINYPLKKQEYDKLVTDYNRYIIQLKFTFRTLDRKIKKTRNSRVAFDMTSSSSALAGTILSTSKNEDQKNVGRVLPAVGVTLVPVKEAVSPNKVNDQNSVSLVRTSIRRLEYILQENGLVSDKDPEIVTKTAKMKADLKQIQQQLIDVPLEEINIEDPKEAAKYFESKKVNRKYRSRKN